MLNTFKILAEIWNKTNKKTRIVVKVGFYIFLCTLLAGAGVAIADLITPGYQENLILIAKALIKISFQLLVEFIGGALIFDYIFN